MKITFKSICWKSYWTQTWLKNEVTAVTQNNSSNACCHSVRVSGCQGWRARENSFQQKQSTALHTWATWLHVGHVPRGWGLKNKMKQFFMTEEIVSEPRDVASAKNIQLFRPLTSSEDIWKSAMNGQFIKEEKGIKRLLKGLFLPIAHSEVL